MISKISQSFDLTSYSSWKDLTQEQLDSMYDQGVYAENMMHVLNSYMHQSQQARELVGDPLRFSYGASDIEQLDWFMGRPGGAINIFIHGGAWRAGSAAQYHFPAPMFLEAGAHFVVPDFINVIDSKGQLLPMVEQVQRAIAWVAKYASDLNADMNQIYISSHSSGSHLTACAAITDWQRVFGLSNSFIKGILFCGGIYELEPVFASSRRRYLDVSENTLYSLSPLRHLSSFSIPSIVAYGELETPEFLRQSREFKLGIDRVGVPAKEVVGIGLNHFEILTTLGERDGLLASQVRKQMNLKS